MWHCHGDIVDDPAEFIVHGRHVFIFEPAPRNGCIVGEQSHRVWPRGYVAYGSELGPVRTILLEVVKAINMSVADRSSRKVMPDA